MTAHYVLRYMRTDDVPQVVEIDRLSFPSPWSPRSYGFEISDNPSSHMVVLEAYSDGLPPSGLRGMLQRLNGHANAPSVIGYGGVWLITGEAHVSTIAVHPNERGKRLGEVLLNGMLMRAITLGGKYSVLEVRVGNEPAQALYRKYGYEVIGRRKNYYRDNNEDAFLMHLAPLDDAYRARVQGYADALHARIAFADRLADSDHGRHSPPPAP